ncbi:MAG: ParB/RepB/Spo0J family partition protein [Archaeoglobaceae archaeon]
MEIREKVQIGNKTFAFVRVKDLKISPYNVRPEITPEEREEIKAELAKSIKELGLQQLPVVTPNGEVFIGGRRTVAFKELGEEWILVEIRDATPFEQLVASYTENFHRKSPDYLHEGRLFKQMCELGGISEVELSKKLGIPRSTISNKIRVYEKLGQILNECSGGTSIPGKQVLSFEDAKMIASIEEDDKRERLVDLVIEKGLKTEDIKRIIATTNAVKSLIEGEKPEIQKKAKEKFEPLYYTPDLDIAEVKWQLEEWAGDSHPLSRGRIWWDEHGITCTEEAVKWFQKYGGVHIRDLMGSEGEWDRVQERMERAKRKK